MKTMNKKCIISYANGLYKNGLRRLEDSLKKISFGGDIKFWYDDLPQGSPDPREVPMAFKAYAFQKAKRDGYDYVLWIDATGIAIRSLDKIFKKIKEDGYYLPGHFSAPVGEWSSDLMLKEFDISREEAMNIPEALTFMIGLNFKKEIGNSFLNEFTKLTTKQEAWRGAGINIPTQDTFNNDYLQISKDARVKGHRHEQTASSLISYKLGMKHTPYYFFDIQGYAKTGKDYADIIPIDTIVIQNRDIKTDNFKKNIDKYNNKTGFLNKFFYYLISLIYTIFKNIKTFIRIRRGLFKKSGLI